MEFRVYANKCDSNTLKISFYLDPLFRKLANNMEGEYSGLMEHLWISFELYESPFSLNDKPKFPFRYQKRVSGRSRLGLPDLPDTLNVGHFSVKPNLTYLSSLSEEDGKLYSLKLICDELKQLKTREKKLGGFNTDKFIEKFKIECEKLGYDL